MSALKISVRFLLSSSTRWFTGSLGGQGLDCDDKYDKGTFQQDLEINKNLNSQKLDSAPKQNNLKSF